MSYVVFCLITTTYVLQMDRMWQPDISYMVGNDAEGFSTFIIELRRLVTDHPRCRDLVADHPDLSSTSNNKVLRKVNMQEVNLTFPDTQRIQRESLFHIKLEAEAEEGVEKTSSIVLVMRCDNLDVIGFINMQDRRAFCYEPGSHRELPGEYTPCLVHPQYPKSCYSTCHIECLRLMHGALNVDEKKN